MTSARATGFPAHLDRREPDVVVVGRGATLYLEGWCVPPAGARLELLVGDDVHPVTTFPFARGDVASALGREALDSGFCAVVRFAVTTAPGERRLALRATLPGGGELAAGLGSVTVERTLDARVTLDAGVTHPVATATSGSRVAICMATYNPDPALFRRQVESIRAQTHEDFVCLVSDDGSDRAALAEIERACAADPRFVLHTDAPRLGFYRNFERCLSLVPADVPYVALSDHDDAWHPDKLATLLATLRKTGAVLAYADMNIVSEDGRLLAPSYWTRRRNNYTDLGSLILANTVTGAASLFRRELLDDVLPFPPNVGHPYHDHWIACVALAGGELAYVDRPLHDYVQHGANIIGHYAPAVDGGGALRRAARLLGSPRGRTREVVAHARAVYFADVVRLQLFAATLELRLGDRLAGERASIVGRIARLSDSPGALLWLTGRRVRQGGAGLVTLGAERQLVRAIAWRDAQQLRGRARRGVLRALSPLRSAAARRGRRP